MEDYKIGDVIKCMGDYAFRKEIDHILRLGYTVKADFTENEMTIVGLPEVKNEADNL